MELVATNKTYTSNKKNNEQKHFSYVFMVVIGPKAIITFFKTAFHVQR